MTATVQAAEPERQSMWVLRSAYGLLTLWAVYLLLAPTAGFSWIESWHNEQRAVQIVLLSATALATTALLLVGSDPLRDRLRLPAWWWIVIALGSLSASLSPFVFAAFAEVGLIVLLSVLVVFTAALTAQQPQAMARLARYVALLIAVAHVLAVLVRYAAALQLGKSVDLSVFMLGYANPRFASALYAILMPFVAAICVDPKERAALRTFALVVLSVVWTINLGLGTRGIWFAVVVGAFAALSLFRSRPMLRLIAALAITGAVGIALYLILALTPGAAGSAASVALPVDRAQTLTSRDVLWSLAWGEITAHPLLGVGPMQFAALKSFVGAHPHNWPLQLASEWGVAALGLVLFALAVTARRARQVASNLNHEALLAVMAALAYGLVDGNLVMPVSQTGAGPVLGLTLGSWPTQAPIITQGLQRIAVVTVTVIATVLVAFYTSLSFSDQPRTTAAFKSTYPREWLVPRFWEQGLLWPERVHDAR